MCYETNFLDAQLHTGEKRTNTKTWLEAGQNNAWLQHKNCNLEVGSRGFLNPKGFKNLLSILENCNLENKRRFLRDISRKAILGSHQI